MNMEYAIIQLNGKQYRVAEGDTLIVDHVDNEKLSKDGTLKVTEVLLHRTEADTVIGAPFVAGASVTLQHATEQKGEKIRVFKFKAKSRYRRTQGYRSHESVFTVSAISA